MKYEIQRLDGRFSYRHLFEYYIKFSNNMSSQQGPLNFSDVQKWFFQTYGWSAEIRIYEKLSRWTAQVNQVSMGKAFNPTSGTLADMPEHCNPNWSWTNGYDDLRIYVASDKELAFFQLAFPKKSQ